MARLRGVSLDLSSLADRFSAAGAVNRAALIAGTLWAVLVVSYAGGYFAGAGGGQARGTAFLDAVFFLVALVLPLGLVVLAAWLAAELARQREAVASLVGAAGPLAEALDATRTALAEEGPVSPCDVEQAVAAAFAQARAELARDLGQAVNGPVAELREGQRRIEAALAAADRPGPAAPAPQPAPAARRSGGQVPRGGLRRAAAATPSAAEAEAQPALPMSAPEPEAALGWNDLLRAFDFPRNAEDRAGFDALRRALRHHDLAQMLQAAEDVLNLLSQEGVYMDDLVHAPAPAESWRAFLQGQRGAEVEAVGGIRDEHALGTVRALMKADPIFRDTSLFFQRRFDSVLTQLAVDADDDVLLALADTRSGRAFMLCARASGSFG
jgi:pyruvate/2-oxoglutarate dehydrogenase complex dihydrolipoamide acyltransferase (E2) component